MRRAGLLALILCLTLVFGCQRERSAPGVLARVDGTAITLEDFNRRFEDMRLENQFAPGGHEATMRMKERLLDQLIEEILILKTADRLGTKVTNEELEHEIMKTKSDYRGESLREYLNRQGIPFEEWKQQLRERLLIEKTIRANSRYDVDISEEEARSYYEAHREDYILPERVKARHIVVTSKRRAATMLRKLKKGVEFEKLAAENSLGLEGRFGGDLGYFARGDMPAEFNVVFSMKPGEVSEVIETPYGFHVFKVEDKQPSRQLAFLEVIDNIRKKIGQIKSEQLYYEWIEELRRNARIEINDHLLEYAL